MAKFNIFFSFFSFALQDHFINFYFIVGNFYFIVGNLNKWFSKQLKMGEGEYLSTAAANISQIYCNKSFDLL